MSSSHRGVTLVELVLTIMLVAVLVLPVGLLVSEVLRLVMMSRDSHVALHLARYELERLDAVDNFRVPDLILGTVEIPNYLGSPYSLFRTVTCEDGDCGGNNTPGLKRIKVEVTKPGVATSFRFVGKVLVEEPEERQAALITFRAKDVAFDL